MVFEGAKYFNCTIQELKLTETTLIIMQIMLFQLHHTGIKTNKTNTIIRGTKNFNCTIQELKQIVDIKITD